MPATTAEELVQLRRREHRERLREHRAQRIQEILTVQWLAPQLVRHRLDDLRMAVSDVENAEAAETVQILAAVYVAIGVGPGVRPFDDRAGAADVARFAVFQEARVDVVAEALDRFARDPAGVVGRDLRLGDEIEN